MANPNAVPPREHQWKPGQSGNPGGLTKAQIEQRRRNRDAAMAIEEKLLAAVTKDLTERESQALEHVRADVLRLIHTAEEELGRTFATSTEDQTTETDDGWVKIVATERKLNVTCTGLV